MLGLFSWGMCGDLPRASTRRVRGFWRVAARARLALVPLAIATCIACTSPRSAPEASARRSLPAGGECAAEPLRSRNAQAPNGAFTRAEPPRVATIVRDAVVLAIGDHGVALRGPVELLNVPEDADSTFLAQRSVDQASIPEALMRHRGAEVTLLKSAEPRSGSGPSELSSCSARLGPLSAYAWANEGQPWAGLSGQAVAEATWKRGTRYLAATLEGGACPLRRWAMFSPATGVRFWRVEPAAEDLGERALVAFRDSSASAARQAAYEAFARQVEAARADVEVERAKGGRSRERLAWYEPEPLPRSWLELPGRTLLWKVDSGADPSLLVGLVERHIAEVLPDDAGRGSAHEVIVFEATLVVVWRYGHDFESTLGTIMGRSPEELSGFSLRGGVSTLGGLPALLFHAYYVNGVLRPTETGYEVDDAVMLRPAEPPGVGQ